jgi:hypothetical protein
MSKQDLKFLGVVAGLVGIVWFGSWYGKRSATAFLATIK